MLVADVSTIPEVRAFARVVRPSAESAAGFSGGVPFDLPAQSQKGAFWESSVKPPVSGKAGLAIARGALG